MNKFINIFLVIIFIFELLFPINFVYAIRPNNEKPVPPEIIEVTEYSITFKKFDGYEYSINGGISWQESNLFLGLEPTTTYTCVQRIQETETYEYSSNSEELNVETKPLASKPIDLVPDGFTGIYSIEDLRKVKNNLSGNYILMNDIIIRNDIEELEPIGNENYPFTGIFNGNNYSISGIKQTNNKNLGLFGYNEGIIINLNVINNNFEITENGEIIKTVGNIAAINLGKIYGCSSKNKIEIDKEIVLGGKESFDSDLYFNHVNIGGIVGLNYGKVYFCNYEGKIDITTQKQHSNIGGIVGHNSGMIKYCYNVSEVISNNESCSSVGGICGTNTAGASIQNTYNVGDISNNNSYVSSTGNSARGCVGGLVGDNSASSNIYYSYTLGKIFYKGAYAGTVCGFNNANISGCYAMYGDKEPSGSGRISCIYIKNCVDTSISQGIENAKEKFGDDFNSNLNYPFPHFKEIGMINIESNFTDYDGGNGLLNNPFRISNGEQLKNIEKNPYSYYVLINDIVFDENEIFEPIDNFYGVLDGNGYKIYNLNVNDNNEYTGLIRKNNGKILNLDIINPNIINTSDGYAGVYTGENRGKIYNCKTELGTIEVNSSIVGAIAGKNHGEIKYCSNSNEIKVNSFETAFCTNVGGLAGIGSGFIDNSSNSGNIIVNSEATDYNKIGGIAGSSGRVTNSYNSGNIYFESDIETSMDIFTGICDDISYSLENCYNVGKIEYKSNSREIKSAGISLSDSDKIKYCYYLKDGINNNTINNGRELEESAMKKQASYAFDFTNIWKIESEGEYLYPTLLQPEILRYEHYSTIFGNISGSNINSKRAKVSLVDKTNNKIIFNNGFVNENGYYEIDNVEHGTYMINVLRDDVIVESQEIIVARDDIKMDFNILNQGDINGDGKVNTADFGLLNAHLRKKKLLEGEEVSRADINGDGKVNTADFGLLNSHLRKKKLLW